MASISHEVLIVADDLTGACDAAAPFAPALVTCREEAFGLHPVLSVSTESRDLSEAEIVRRMQFLAQAIRDPKLIFKKIDSVLRGNVPAEIKAAMEAFHCTTAVITPAFPDMGRTVKNGHLHIDGVLAKHAGENVRDALTNQDLDAIVDEGLQLSGRILWAGSGGLAAALARRLHGLPPPIAPPPIEGPIAFCIGSDHPATLAQQAELTRLHPDSRIVPIRRTQRAEQIRSALNGAAALFITGGDTATQVLEAVAAKGILIRHQVVTGVPWGVVYGGIFHRCPIVTKSGGFGAPDTLIKVARFFTPHP